MAFKGLVGLITGVEKRTLQTIDKIFDIGGHFRFFKPTWKVNNKMIQDDCYLTSASLGVFYNDVINHFEQIVDFYEIADTTKLVERIPIVKIKIQRSSNIKFGC